jgi:hypothetical protein
VKFPKKYDYARLKLEPGTWSTGHTLKRFATIRSDLLDTIKAINFTDIINSMPDEQNLVLPGIANPAPFEQVQVIWTDKDLIMWERMNALFAMVQSMDQRIKNLEARQ